MTVALIFLKAPDFDSGMVEQIADDGADFPVAPPLEWKTADPGVERGWSWDAIDGYQPPPSEPIPPTSSEKIDAKFANDKTYRGLVRATAARLAVDVNILLSEIKTEADN